ncbi:MAG: hypothetical protein QMD77_01965 [Patescibacteria group bacterium]|nr:hypothetical protein [Patescibacteria group bacterium]
MIIFPKEHQSVLFIIHKSHRNQETEIVGIIKKYSSLFCSSIIDVIKFIFY